MRPQSAPSPRGTSSCGWRSAVHVEKGHRLPVHTDGLARPRLQIATFSDFQVIAIFLLPQQARQHLVKYMLAFYISTCTFQTRNRRDL